MRRAIRRVRGEKLKKRVMQKTLCYSVSSLAIFLSACASIRQSTVPEAVGPPPFVGARHTPEGELVVYSAFDPGSTSDPDARIHHAGYRIYSADGKQLK